MRGRRRCVLGPRGFRSTHLQRARRHDVGASDDWQMWVRVSISTTACRTRVGRLRTPLPTLASSTSPPIQRARCGRLATRSQTSIATRHRYSGSTLKKVTKRSRGQWSGRMRSKGSTGHMAPFECTSAPPCASARQRRVHQSRYVCCPASDWQITCFAKTRKGPS